jgi:shikimate dehydrogenase
MQRAALREVGLDGWTYQLLPVPPGLFEETVRALPAAGFAGANVTIPHKLRALALADRASDVARATGAANTLLFTDEDGKGRIEAENTDVIGFLEALREQAPEAPEGMEAVVLGAGGAARAVVYGLLVAGAARVSVWNRHPDRARALVQDLAQTGQGRLEATEEPDVARAHLWVNATSVGMQKQDSSTSDATQAFKELPLSADVWGDRQIMVDLVYRQNGTALAREARSRGVVCVDGLDVLVHQGAASFQLWTGREAPLGAMRRGAEDGKTY